jgi:hypothetical protein
MFESTQAIQMRNSFYHYAMRYQEILRQRWQESSQNIVDDCWFQGGLSPEMCCIPAGTGTDWCFDAVYTYERCCKGIQAPAAWVPSKAALPEVRDQPNFVEPDGTLSARPQLTVDLFIRSRFAVDAGFVATQATHNFFYCSGHFSSTSWLFSAMSIRFIFV